mgnify:CR=1 FL=1
MTRIWLILIAALMAGHVDWEREGAIYRFYGPGDSTTVTSITANAVSATYAAIRDAYDLVTGPSGREYPAHAVTSPACERVTDYLYRFEGDLTERIEDARAASDMSRFVRLDEELRFIQEGPEEWRPVSIIPEVRPAPWVWGNCLRFIDGRHAFLEFENCLAYGVNAADLQECMVDSRRGCLERSRVRRICEALPLPPVDDHTRIY